MKIAFLVLAHRQIDLVCKQIEVLDHPQHVFFIHLDKKYKLTLDHSCLNKENVFFLQKRYNVVWGGFNMILATLELMKKALCHPLGFDYFVLMSGQCFPVKSKEYFRNFLQKNYGKSFIEQIPLPDKRLQNGGMDKFIYPWFFDFFSFIKKDTIYIHGKKYEPKKWLLKSLAGICKLLGIKRRIPYQLKPCFGSQWWVLHRSAINYIIEYIKYHPGVLQFFKNTFAPDELFFQTILYNSPLREFLVNRSLWYIDWNTNGPPKTLNMDDLLTAIKKEVIFARKLDSLNIVNECIKIINQS